MSDVADETIGVEDENNKLCSYFNEKTKGWRHPVRLWTVTITEKLNLDWTGSG